MEFNLFHKTVKNKKQPNFLSSSYYYNLTTSFMKKIILLLSISLGQLYCYSQQWTFLGFPDQRINAVAVNPQDPNIVFCAGEGIYKSNDGGLNWDTVSIYTGFNSFTFYPYHPDTMYATLGMGSLSDGIYKSVDEGNTWDVLELMPGSTSLVISDDPSGTMLAGTLGTGVMLSADHGNTWTEFNDSIDNLDVLCIVAAYPVCIPEDPITIYVAGTEGGIFYYPDHYFLPSADEYWHNANLATNSIIPAISTAQAGNYLWAVEGEGSWSDGMYNSVNFGDSWIVSEYWPFMTDILINQIDPNTVYAADSGNGVKRTINNGLIWETINEQLGDSVVFCLAQSPMDTIHLYAGTEHGLYVYDFTTGINSINNKSDLTIFPNPATDKVTIRSVDYEINKVEIINPEGQILQSRFIKTSEGNLNIDFLENGIYFIKIHCDRGVVLKKLIKQ